MGMPTSEGCGGVLEDACAVVDVAHINARRAIEGMRKRAVTRWANWISKGDGWGNDWIG